MDAMAIALVKAARQGLHDSGGQGAVILALSIAILALVLVRSIGGWYK